MNNKISNKLIVAVGATKTYKPIEERICAALWVSTNDIRTLPTDRIKLQLITAVTKHIINMK